MDAYETLRDKHQKEIDDFPMFFAFNINQFEEGMKKLGLKKTDTKKICSIGPGGYIRKTDAQAMHEIFFRHHRELREAIKGDTTGDGFIFEMFSDELANHEYCVTYDTEDALNAIGLTMDEIQKSPALTHGLKKACEAQISAMER